MIYPQSGKTLKLSYKSTFIFLRFCSNNIYLLLNVLKYFFEVLFYPYLRRYKYIHAELINSFIISLWIICFFSISLLAIFSFISPYDTCAFHFLPLIFSLPTSTYVTSIISRFINPLSGLQVFFRFGFMKSSCIKNIWLWKLWYRLLIFISALKLLEVRWRHF